MSVFHTFVLSSEPLPAVGGGVEDVILFFLYNCMSFYFFVAYICILTFCLHSFCNVPTANMLMYGQVQYK